MDIQSIAISKKLHLTVISIHFSLGCCCCCCCFCCCFNIFNNTIEFDWPAIWPSLNFTTPTPTTARKKGHTTHYRDPETNK